MIYDIKHIHHIWCVSVYHTLHTMYYIIILLSVVDTSLVILIMCHISSLCPILLWSLSSHALSYCMILYHMIYLNHIILHHFYEICMCYLTSYFNFPYLYTISHIISYYHISCISLLYHYYIITNSFVYSMSYVNLMSYLIPMILFNV